MWRSVFGIFRRGHDVVKKAADIVMSASAGLAKDKQEKPEHIVRLERHRDLLIKCMEPESGLIDHLLSVGVFTHRELEYAHSEVSVESKNRRILEFMMEKDKENYDKFLESLSSTKQSHIVRYLNGDGIISPDYPDDRPLTKHEISIICDNIDRLVRTMEPFSVTDHLFALDCLTRRSVTLIKSKETEEEVTTQLLDVMTRRSKRDLKTFHATLKEHKQDEAAQILEPALRIIGFIPDSLKNDIKYEENYLIKNLHAEVLEIILLKAFLFEVSASHIKRKDAMRSTVANLSCVSSAWNLVTSKEQFKNILKSRVEGLVLLKS